MAKANIHCMLDRLRSASSFAEESDDLRSQSSASSHRFAASFSTPTCSTSTVLRSPPLAEPEELEEEEDYSDGEKDAKTPETVVEKPQSKIPILSRILREKYGTSSPEAVVKTSQKENELFSEAEESEAEEHQESPATPEDPSSTRQALATVTVEKALVKVGF
ncbi:hypothetical protein L596_014786 [Steinernema carpocapsae]|uniref:Uncharacterized protein n=1 Tax=Steinernema carpocapsae TaxID=34508 RepID=A0A4U5NDV4_STECR|nr:hypothetical protein L596_014786 [Steinernema carpocapsae]